MNRTAKRHMRPPRRGHRRAPRSSVQPSPTIDPVLSALTAAARHDADLSALRWVYDLDPDVLLAASRAHGVDHLVLDWITIIAPDHAVVQVLRRRNVAAARFHLRALAALRGAGRALESAGVRYLAVKGPVLATLAPTASSRVYGDLDLLVAPGQLEVALDALTDTGAAFSESAQWRVLLESEHAQVPMLLPVGMSLDLHWDLCSRPHMRRSWNVDGAEALLSRSGSLNTAAGAVPVLDWNDMLIHTAGHAGWSGGDRLGWLVDVDSVVRSGQVDWDIVVNRTRAWSLEPLVGDLLNRTGQLLHTAIPSEVTRALRGGALGSLLRTSDRLFPMTGIHNGRSASRLLRLDTRAGLPSTLGEVRRRAVGAVSRRVRSSGADDLAKPSQSNDENWRRPYLSFASGGSIRRPG